MNRIDKRKLERYEMVVYISLLLLAVILGFVGNSIDQEIIKSITINLASELLAVGILFFIVNRMFLLGKNNDDLPSSLLDVLTRDNSPLMMKFDLLKNELSSRIQKVSEQVGEEVNAQLELDSNKLYTFFGLKGTRQGSMFQDFRVYRSDPRRPNDNAVSFLWADTLYGNTINASIQKNGEAFLRVNFQSFSSQSWGCNIAIKPQNQKASYLQTSDFEASDLSEQDRLRYLVFQARIPEEVLQENDLLQNIGVAIRVVNGKYQHWDYGNYSKEYIRPLAN